MVDRTGTTAFLPRRLAACPTGRPEGRRTWVRAAATAVAALAVGGPLSAQELPPTDPGWQAAGDARIGEWEGRPALLIRRGQIDHPELKLADGTLEFDLLIPEGRTFIGMRLRVGPDGTNENFYLRPHKSGLPDAVQYNPAFGGAGQWQLWHGPTATAFAHFTPGDWVRVRVELAESQAALFLDGGPEPVLVTSRLATGRRSGHLGFWANQPGAGPQDPWTAVIRNVRVLPGKVTHAFPAPEPVTAPEGTVARWSLSLAWGSAPTDDPRDFPPAIIESDWKTVEVEPTGLLAIQRHRSRPPDGGATVLARIVLESDRARTVDVDVGFSDDAVVFLNGRPVATGRNGYSYNLPRRDGLLTPRQMTVHLPLRAGDNELLVRVRDTFGGWGLQASIPDRTGLEVWP